MNFQVPVLTIGWRDVSSHVCNSQTRKVTHLMLIDAMVEIDNGE
jgi:hypothetical protein